MLGALLAHETEFKVDPSLTSELQDGLNRCEDAIDTWGRTVGSSRWLNGDSPTYFLARGPSVATCHEARLLWEEAAKMPASALTTGGFRHGPQEIVHSNLRLGIWLHDQKMRDQDLALVADLCRYGAHVLLIGQGIDEAAAEVVINLPTMPLGWQFLVDVIPIQIAAERLAHLRGKDCDSFHLCSYIVTKEGGLSSVGIVEG